MNYITLWSSVYRMHIENGREHEAAMRYAGEAVSAAQKLIGPIPVL